MANRSTDFTVRILGDYDSLRKTITKSIGQVDRLNKSVKGSGKTSFKDLGKAAMGAAAGLGAIAIAGNEVKKSVNDTIDLAKATRQLQRATGLASKDASALAAVLKVRGVDTQKAGRSFTTLARQIESAKAGSASATTAFKQLGVSQKTLQSGNFNQVLLQMADGFKGLGDGTAKASVAQQLFGRGSRDVLPLLEGGSKALREQLGLAPQLSKAQQEQALKTVAAQRSVSLAMLNVRTTIGTALMPAISTGAEKFAKFVEQMKTGKGAGGEFAAKVKEIWTNVKPALEKLVDLGKAVFNFAANHPQVVKIASSLAAVGLAIKAIKFGSSISGLTTFINTAKGLGGPLKKLFSRFGSRAGTAFAGEAAGNMAADMGTAVAPSGKLGKMAGKEGKFAKWGGRAGRVARFAFIAAFTYLLVKDIGDKMGPILDNLLGKFGLGPNDAHGDRSGQDLSAPRTVKPGDMPGKVKPGRRAGAKASSLTRYSRARALRPTLNLPTFGIGAFGRDPLTHGIPMEVLLARADARATRAQNRVDRYQNSTGSSMSKAETARLKQLTQAAKTAQAEVDKLQKKLNRRDALMEIQSQFKDYAQSFTDAYAQGLQNIADARLNTAQTVAQKTLDAQLKALDEEQGSSEEARRIRELRAQQETENRTREDEDYAKNKQAIETDLQRAIRNGNLKGQQELQQQLNDLDQQRRDTLRAREIQDLSDSLQRQRNAAQSDYEARVGAAQDYYDKQVELNKQAVADYKTVIDQQVKLLTDQLAAGVISYDTFNKSVDGLNKWLTGMFKGDLDNRAEDERKSLEASFGKVSGYVVDVNTEFKKVMSTMPVPSIPPIPQISIDAVLNIQNLDQIKSILNGGSGSGGGGGNSGSGANPSGELSIKQMQDFFRQHRGLKYKLSYLATIFRRPADNLKTLLTGVLKPDVAGNKIKIDYNRASGGRLAMGPGALTMVGETGPELVMNGQVYSATRTARMRGKNGVTLNVYPRTTANDPTELARALGWQLATR